MALVSRADIEQRVRAASRRWLVTGSAGFIGSHLVEALLRLEQQVVSIDNFATGHRVDFQEVRAAVGEAAWAQHEFIEGDITDLAACRKACANVEIVLHQAALGSVPRSIENPLATHATNVTGFLNMLVAARDAGVKRLVYAASSSTYGDHPGLPKREDVIGRPLSPYAVTKYANELYADVFGRCYDLQTIGLRYFNVFGSRQDPEGAYAAVIPRWIAAMLKGKAPVINGDGETSRDFCYVANVVQANLLAALTTDPAAVGSVYNVAAGGRTTLNELHERICEAVQAHCPEVRLLPPAHADFRRGDVRHSQADIGRARANLGYEPECDVSAGLGKAMPWYVRRLSATSSTGGSG